MVDNRMIGPIVVLRQPALSDGHPHSVGESLSQGPGGDFHPGGFASLWVAGGLGAPLPESLQLIEREVVSGEMEEGVEKHGGVAGRQDEAIAVGPIRALRVVPQESIPESEGHGGGAHRRARVAGFRGLDGVDRQETDSVDAQLLQFRLITSVHHDGPPAPS